ncbi:hypothetical protein K8R47_00890 [archaeon]|nr:hypothetical protein [archaeon]
MKKILSILLIMLMLPLAFADNEIEDEEDELNEDDETTNEDKRHKLSYEFNKNKVELLKEMKVRAKERIQNISDETHPRGLEVAQIRLEERHEFLKQLADSAINEEQKDRIMNLANHLEDKEDKLQVLRERVQKRQRFRLWLTGVSEDDKESMKEYLEQIKLKKEELKELRENSQEEFQEVIQSHIDELEEDIENNQEFVNTYSKKKGILGWIFRN